MGFYSATRVADVHVNCPRPAVIVRTLHGCAYVQQLERPTTVNRHSVEGAATIRNAKATQQCRCAYFLRWWLNAAIDVWVFKTHIDSHWIKLARWIECTI